MKRTIGFILLSSILSLSSCWSPFSKKTESDTPTNINDEPIVAPAPAEETEKSDVLYIGLFETKEYNPDSKLQFTVTVGDTSIVTYENGAFTSFEKEGSTTATFSSNSMKYYITVKVVKYGTFPYFNVDSQSIMIRKGTDYLVKSYITYRGVDIDQYASPIKITKETNNNSSSAVVVGDSIKFSGNNIGFDSFTVYREFAGFVLSKRIDVSTKTSNGLAVCGHSLTYNEFGPQYVISMYHYSENPISLEDDLTVLKGDDVVPYSSILITAKDSNVIDIVDGYLLPKKAGTTLLSLTYEDEVLTIMVTIFKPVLLKERLVLENIDFNLNMSVEVDKNKKTRTYTSDSSMTKVIEIPGEEDLIDVMDISVNEKKIDFDSVKASYDSVLRTVSLSAELFSVMNYGRQNVEITLQSSDALYVYYFNLNFITKVIETLVDVRTYFRQFYDTDVIYGQYILEHDVDMNGYAPSGEYVNLSSLNYDFYNYGFRGILDGHGYAFTNFTTTMYGFFLVIGKEAIVKDISFTDVHYRSIPNNSTLGDLVIGRFISGASFSNITITLAADSVSDIAERDGSVLTDFGVFATQVLSYSTIVDLTINAQGFDLIRPFGNNVSGTVFRNTNIYCKSMTILATNKASIDGVTVHLDA